MEVRLAKPPASLTQSTCLIGISRAPTEKSAEIFLIRYAPRSLGKKATS